MRSKGKPVSLEVEEVTAAVHMCEKVPQFEKEGQDGQFMMAHLFSIKGEEEEPSVNPTLHPVLEEYHSLFSEPQNLPPKRSIDHQIHLKPDSKPISLRPYRFSFF